MRYPGLVGPEYQEYVFGISLLLLLLYLPLARWVWGISSLYTFFSSDRSLCVLSWVLTGLPPPPRQTDGGISRQDRTKRDPFPSPRKSDHSCTYVKVTQNSSKERSETCQICQVLTMRRKTFVTGRLFLPEKMSKVLTFPQLCLLPYLPVRLFRPGLHFPTSEGKMESLGGSAWAGGVKAGITFPH